MKGPIEKIKFSVKEDPALEGSFKIKIQSSKPINISSGYALLKCGPNECVALIDSIEAGNNLILIDRFLQFRLGDCKEKDVELESIDLKNAEKVKLIIPSELLKNNRGKEWIKDNLLDKPLTEGLETRIYTLSGSKSIIISQIEPSPYAILRKETRIEFKSLEKIKEETIGETWETVGALENVKNKIRELVEYPIFHPDIVTYLGIEPPTGILLYGPPGTGKTLIAKALYNELRRVTNAYFEIINGPEIMSAYYGVSEKILREKFENASKNATLTTPSIILIDEIDSIAPKRDATKGELESRLVATLLTLMDGLKEKKGVIVIGTTNRINSIDPALRRPGRFEYELYVGIPDVQGRKEILEIHTRRKRRMPLDGDVDLQGIAEKTYGFVGADLAFLCREAGRNAFRRSFLSEKEKFIDSIEERPPLLSILSCLFEEESPPVKIDEILKSIKVTKADFEEALTKIVPSGMRELIIEFPRDITWDKIGGLKGVKQIIRENIIHGIKKSVVFKDMGIRPARGILLYGPPGTGKTLIARAIANECGANFIAIRGPEIRSRWFGESEEKVRFIFETARRHAPCIVFLDEADALVPVRGRGFSNIEDAIVNQFLAEIDGIKSMEGVFIICTTNRVELLDDALLRPGRIDYHIYVPLPDKEARKEIFNIHLKKDVIEKDIDIEKLAEITKGFSGAEIAEVCRLAGLSALREVNFERVNFIRMEHLLSAIYEIKEKRNIEETETETAPVVQEEVIKREGSMSKLRHIPIIGWIFRKFKEKFQKSKNRVDQ